MNKFLLICACLAAVAVQANGFTVSSSNTDKEAEGKKAAVTETKEATSSADKAAKTSAKSDSLSSAVTEMKKNADDAINAPMPKQDSAKKDDVKDNSKTPSIMSSMPKAEDDKTEEVKTSDSASSSSGKPTQVASYGMPPKK